jgi:transposase-like protein
MIDGLTPAQCREICQALRDGNIPPTGVGVLCVGRDKLVDGFRQRFQEASADKSGTCKFIRGQWGYGKSFLLQVLAELAMGMDWASSFIVVSADLRFNRLDDVYRAAAGTIRTAKARGVPELLRNWVRGMRDEIAESTRDIFDTNSQLLDLARENLAPLREHSDSFRQAVFRYVEATVSNNKDLAATACAWLTGDPNLPHTRYRELNVKGRVEHDNAMGFLRSLSSLVRITGHSGFLIMVDEAERIRHLPQQRLRDDAYDNIRMLWDEANGGGLPSTLIMFAATDEFFEHERGAMSYGALESRIGSESLLTDSEDTRYPVVSLQRLTADELRTLAGELLAVHSKANDWDADEYVGGATLDAILAGFQRKNGLAGGNVVPRNFVKAYMRIIDYVSEHPDVTTKDVLSRFDGAVDEAEHEQPAAPWMT